MLSSIGNDIIDLQHLESDITLLHPRFQNKILNEQELRDIKEITLSKKVLLWLYWGAKESAYKALKRIDPSISFSWRNFFFNYKEKTVSYKNYKCYLQFEIKNNDYIHVISHINIMNCESIISKVYNASDLLHNNTSSKYISNILKRLFIQDLAKELKCTTSELSIEKPSKSLNIPFLKFRNKIQKMLISFSHDGNYLSYTCISGNGLNI